MPVSKTNQTINSSASWCVPTPLNLDRSMLDQGVIRGYAARFSDGLFAPGAFRASLDRWRDCGATPHMTWNGDPFDVVGKWTNCIEDSQGLLVTGKIILGTERGDRVRQALRGGIDGLTVLFNQKAKTGDKVSEAHIGEISLMREADIPAPKAAAPTKLQNSIDFESWMRDRGMPKAAARKLAAGGWPGLSAGKTESNPDEALEALSKALGLANHQLSTRR